MSYWKSGRLFLEGSSQPDEWMLPMFIYVSDVERSGLLLTLREFSAVIFTSIDTMYLCYTPHYGWEHRKLLYTQDYAFTLWHSSLK